MKTPLTPSRCATGALLLSLARLGADTLPLTPVLDSTAGLAGTQSRVTWPAQPGVRYRVEKSTGVASDGTNAWSARALVEAKGSTGEWVDPEAQSSRAFFRVPTPQPEVFQIQPPVLSSGGELWVEAQCLPPGTSLTFEVDGQPPIIASLVENPDGTYRVTLPVIAPSAIGARITKVSLMDALGATVVEIGQQFEITASGLATIPPPVLPPVIAADQRVKTRSNIKNDRWISPDSTDCDDCDDSDPARVMGNDPRVLLPNVAGLTQHSRGDSVYDSINLSVAGTCDMRRSKRSEAELNLNAIERQGARPGSVVLHQCDLSLMTPAGPPIEWSRTYTSQRYTTDPASTWDPAFDFSWNVRIVPEPLADGVSAPRIFLFTGDGRRDILVRQADGTYTCDGAFRSGRFNPDTSFTLTFSDQSRMIFCPLVGAPWQGRLGSLLDPNGVAVTCTYTASGQLNTISSQFGQSLTCTYESDGLLSKVTDHLGRYVSYTRYTAGETGGSPGRIKSVSCPIMPGQAPLAGPTTYTYTTGFPDAARNDNLLTVTDGENRLVSGFIYSSQSNPAAIDYDTCASSDFHRSHPLTGHVTLYKFEVVPPGVYPPGSYRCISNDALGRVDERVFNACHCLISLRQFTGFSTPGVPVTSSINRPSGKLRTADPDFYETTWLYNGQHLCTRETLADGTQQRLTYECDLNPRCAVSDRGNLRVMTLRTPAGPERSITCDYLSGFGTPEGVWPGEDGNGGCTERRLPIRNLGSSGEDGVSLSRIRHRGWDGLIYGNRKGWDGLIHGTKGFDKYTEGIDQMAATGAGGSPPGTGGSPQPLFSSNPIPGVGVVIKRNPKKTTARSAGPGVWAGEDGDGGCTDDSNMWGRGTNPDGSDCTNKGRPKLGSSMLAAGHIIPIGCGGGSGIGGNLRPGSPIGGLSIKGGRNYPTRLITSYGQIFTWSYDPGGNCTATRTPIAGGGCGATYNALGQCTTFTVLNGPGSSFTEECTYSPATGWMTGHIVDPSGLHLTTTFEADALGRVTRCVNPLGHDFLTDYNALDLVTSTRSPLLGTAPSTWRIECTYFYDLSGLPARIDLDHRDETGAPVSSNPAYSAFIVYTSRGQVARLATEQRPVNVPTTPPVLDPSASGIENFAVTDLGYNDAGECVRVSTPAACRGQSADAVYECQFDERGYFYRGISGGLGAVTTVTTQMDYDVIGAPVAISLLPSSSAGGGEPLTTTCTWDAFHRLKSCISAMGVTTVYDHDDQGSTTCSVYGETRETANSAANVLLARGRQTSHPAVLSSKGSCVRAMPAGFFCRYAPEDISVNERFAPGDPAPHATEVTTVQCSPAGLVMSISCNGDLLMSNTYDTAGRSLSSTDGKVIHVCVRDAAGNVSSSTRMDLSTAAGVPSKTYTTLCVRDPLGRTTSGRDTGGNVVTSAFDSCNRIVRYTNAPGVTYVSRWDGNFDDGTPSPKPYTLLIEADTDGDGDFEMLRQCTCTNGYWVRTTDSYLHTTSIVLDPLNRQVQCDHPDGTHEAWLPDAYGRLTMHMHKDGTVVVADLDRDGRLDRVVYGSLPGTLPVPPIQYSYNGLGFLVGMDQGESHIACTYDSMGNQLTQTHNGQGVARTFNHRGRTGIIYPNGTRFAEVRDGIGQIVSVSAVTSAGVVLSPPVSLTEYAGHRVSREVRRNGVVTTHEYRADGDAPLPGGGEDFSFDTCVRTVCTDASGSVIHATRVRRDRSQAVTQCDTFFSSAAQSAGRRRTNTWNRLGHLTGCTIQRREVTGGPLVTESSVTYMLDVEGRRLTATGGANPGVYTQSALTPPGDRQMGQYTTWSGGALEWDDEGSLTLMSSSSGQKQFIYNAASQLVAVNNAATGEAIATYAYDAAGNRTRSSVSGGSAGQPAVSTFFVYDGATCVQELGDDGLPNVTVAGSETGGIALCVTSRNGTLVYPHGGGGSGGGGGSAAKFNYPILPAWIEPLKEIEVEDPVLELHRLAGGGHGGGGGGGCGGGIGCGAGLKKFDWAPKLEGGKEGCATSRDMTAVMGWACTAGPDGIVRERLDGNDAFTPVFLTSDGLVRPGATGTLAGFDWFACSKGSGGCNLVWSPRSNIILYGRSCPESGFMQCGEAVYSTQLGLGVSTAKEKPKSGGSGVKASWNLKENVK